MILMHRNGFVLAVLVAALGVSALAQGDVIECGALENPMGPFDYRDPANRAGPSNPLHLVEIGHYTTDVQTLTKGNTGFYVDGDLDYTLRAFPNHHPALYTMIQYYTDASASTRRPLPRTADCYFDRALRFQPDDETVWMLYG